MLAQFVRRADARQHQELRRVVRAAAQDHFARGGRIGRPALAQIFHADRAAVLDPHLARQRVRDDREVLALHRRLEKRLRRRMAAAETVNRHLRRRDALRLVAVHVLGFGNASGFRRVAQRLVEQRRIPPEPHVQRAVAAVILVLAAIVSLRPLEVGQHVRKAPALVAELPPLVVIAKMAARIAHAVDRGRTAEHLATRERQLASAAMGVGLALESPVELRRHHRGRPRNRQFQERMPVAAAGFEQQHIAVTILGEAVGQHAAGRAGADDDVVVRWGHGVPSFAVIVRQFWRG